jgi:hypothetical protein
MELPAGKPVYTPSQLIEMIQRKLNEERKAKTK